MKGNKERRHIPAMFLVVILVVSVLATVPMAGADPGDAIDDFIGTGPYICIGYATTVLVDVDEDGTDDTQVVFATNTGEAYVDVDSSASGKWYFFTGMDNHCGGFTPWNRGRFVINFVDILAPGFVWDNSTTWTYKRIPSLSVEAYHDGSVASGDWSTAYQSVQAYQNRFQIDPKTGTSTPIGDWSVGCGWTLHEFSDSTGIMELYVSTDYCENILDDLILKTATIIDTDGDGISDADETAGWDITEYNCDGSVSGTYPVTSDPTLADTDGDGLSDFEEKEGWHVSCTISTGPVEYDVQSNPGVADYDGDGKTDAEEATAGTDPNRGDTDCDSAYDTNDGFEMDNWLNPLHFDTDGDGVSDGEEIDRWVAAGYSLADAIANTNDSAIPPMPGSPELCPDKYRWGSYNWDPAPDTFVGRQEVRFVNHGTGDAYNVIATVTCMPVNVVASDPNVTLGDIPASGSAWSSDIFELRVDMTNPQDPNKGICWRVEYDDAAGVHHVIEDVAMYCGDGCSDICP